MHARQQMTKDWETNKIPAPHPQISTGGMHQCAGEQLLRYWYACSGSQVLKSPKGDQFSNKHEIRFKSLLFLAVLVQGACSLGTWGCVFIGQQVLHHGPYPSFKNFRSRTTGVSAIWGLLTYERIASHPITIYFPHFLQMLLSWWLDELICCFLQNHTPHDWSHALFFRKNTERPHLITTPHHAY